MSSSRGSRAPTPSSTPTSRSGHDDEKTAPMSTIRAIVLTVTVTMAMVQNMSNVSSAAIALPSIAKDLQIAESELQWIVSAYSLSSGCLLIFFGRLADLYGKRRAFILGSLSVSLFGLGCGFANDSVTLNVLRGLQGVGAAATIPASLGILAHSFPPSKARSIAFATFAAGAPVGGAFGMVIGGVLTQLTNPTWRSTFYFNAALGLVCLFGAITSIEADPPLRRSHLSASSEAERRVDWLGALLVTSGLVLIVFVLSAGETAPQGWKTPYIIALLILGVLLLPVFVYWQHTLQRYQDARASGRTTPRWAAPPLMRLSLWTPKISGIMLIAFLNWSCFLAWQFWAQLYYQQYEGLSPILTMVRMLPCFVTGVLANVVIAALVGRVDVWMITAFGTLCTGCATLFFALSPPATFDAYWSSGFPSAILAVIGTDFVFAAGTLFVAKLARPEEQSLAGGVFQTMTQLGTSFGLTVSTIVFDRVSRQNQSIGNERQGQVKGYEAAQWTCFAFGMAATVIAVVFLRGVGVVGHPPARKGAQVNEVEVEKDSSRRESMTSEEQIASPRFARDSNAA